MQIKKCAEENLESRLNRHVMLVKLNGKGQRKSTKIGCSDVYPQSVIWNERFTQLTTPLNSINVTNKIHTEPPYDNLVYF